MMLFLNVVICAAGLVVGVVVGIGFIKCLVRGVEFLRRNFGG